MKYTKIPICTTIEGSKFFKVENFENAAEVQFGGGPFFDFNFKFFIEIMIIFYSI